MHTANCCFLNLIILYFNFNAINASTNIFTYTQNTGLIEPCIESVCSEFTVKRQLNEICVPGRCECPEERQYCTNGYANQPIKIDVDFNSTSDNRLPLKGHPRLVQRAAYTLTTFLKHYVFILIVYVMMTFKYMYNQYRRRRLFIGRILLFILPLIAVFSSIVTLYEVGLRRFLAYFMLILTPIIFILTEMGLDREIFRRRLLGVTLPFILYFSSIVLLDYCYGIVLP